MFRQIVEEKLGQVFDLPCRVLEHLRFLNHFDYVGDHRTLVDQIAGCGQFALLFDHCHNLPIVQRYLNFVAVLRDEYRVVISKNGPCQHGDPLVLGVGVLENPLFYLALRATRCKRSFGHWYEPSR